MSLPNLPAGDKFRREVRTEWGGLNLNENAGDGELIEAMNMSSREFPVLATRRTWYTATINATPYRPQITDAAALGASRRAFWVSKSSGVWKFFYSFAEKGTLSATTRDEAAKIRFAVMQDKIYIFPDKKCYDETADTLGSIKASWSSCAYFDNGTIDGVAAEANTIKGTGIGSGFRPGDAVTISGCSAVPENNKTVIVREVDTDELRFYENTFTLGSNKYVYTATGAVATGKYCIKTDSGGYSFMLALALANGDTVTFDYDVYQGGPGFVYTSGGHAIVEPASEDLESATELAFELVDSTDPGHTEVSITVSRTVPDMDFICVNENRVWGCKGDTIYASKLGDPLNWNVFDGLSTDSWTAETGTPGDFTGCVSYQGYPVFFKENFVFRVMGDSADQFYIRKLDIPGVSNGSDLSVAVVESTLYYLANKGICAWNGSSDPTVISNALGIDRRWCSGRAGSDGKRYYLSAFEMIEKPLEYPAVNWEYRSRDLCYDTRFGTWHEINISKEQYAWDSNRPTGYSCYARQGDKLYFLDSDTNNFLMLEGVPDANSVGIGTLWGTEGINRLKPQWIVTFADSTRAYKTALTGSESKKGVLRLLIRCRLAGSMKVWIAYDGGEFEEAGEFGGETGMAKGSRVVPLILRRCDFWQLRLTGTGDAVIYSIAVERYGGEWQQA